MILALKHIFLIRKLRRRIYLKGKGGRAANVYLGIVKRNE